MKKAIDRRQFGIGGAAAAALAAAARGGSSPADEPRLTLRGWGQGGKTARATAPFLFGQRGVIRRHSRKLTLH